jgi:hypothetical protein
MMTFTTDLIQLQSDLKDQVKGAYKLQNTWNGTRIISKETIVYSAMKSYLERNNLHYFTFSPNSGGEKKNYNGSNPPLLPDTWVEFISNSLEDSDFIINVRQRMATWTAPNRQNHVESLLLFLLSKQLQDLHIDVALLSEKHLKPHERFFFQIIIFMSLPASQEEKAELPLQLQKPFSITMQTCLCLLQ